MKSTKKTCATCGKKANVKITYDWTKQFGEVVERYGYRCFEHYVAFENAHRETDEFVVAHVEII
jgi:hypothetical protein